MPYEHPVLGLYFGVDQAGTTDEAIAELIPLTICRRTAPHQLADHFRLVFFYSTSLSSTLRLEVRLAQILSDGVGDRRAADRVDLILHIGSRT